MRELDQFAQASNSTTLNTAAAITRLGELMGQLAEPATIVAAFDDLQVAVEDDTSTPQTIQSRLAVVTCALELAGHTSAQVCRFASEIVDDQLREIDVAHQMDCSVPGMRDRGVLGELFNAVHAVLRDYTLELTEDRHELLDRIEKHDPTGTVTRDYAATFDLVSYLLQGAPTHHPTLIRLLEVHRHIQSTATATVGAWIEKLEADYRRRVARTRRLRNGLTHSGAAQVDLVRTVRILINIKARNLAQLTLEAVLTNETVPHSLTSWKDEFDTSKSEIAIAPDPRRALVGKVGTR